MQLGQFIAGNRFDPVMHARIDTGRFANALDVG
jgi:hypothetical protein